MQAARIGTSQRRCRGTRRYPQHSQHDAGRCCRSRSSLTGQTLP